MYVAILTSKLKSKLPAGIEKAALQAGLPSSSLPSLLENFSTNITVVPGINPEIMEAVGTAVKQGYADSFRYRLFHDCVDLRLTIFKLCLVCWTCTGRILCHSRCLCP